MPIFVFFESQCPKIMVLSKALKAKLSSIPSGVASTSMLDLDWGGGKLLPSWTFVRPPIVATLLCARGLLEAPLGIMRVVRIELQVLSLSVEEGICLPLVVRQEFGPNFKVLPKVSGVTTNHWISLRCDWSLVSS